MRSLLRWIGRATLVLYFAAATIIIVGRYLIVPEINAWRGMIEQQLSTAIGLPVEIGGLRASWPGLQPYLSIDKLQVRDRNGEPALAFDRVEAEIGWASFLFMELRLHRLEIFSPALDIRRDSSGVVYIAGLPLQGDGESGFADWLLEQYRIVVRDARITWHDELRGAPPLTLDKLDFVLRNLGRNHSFGLTAEPSGSIAAHIDVRANLSGRSFDDLSGWQGASYADLAGIDLAALAPWLDLPLELNRGKGDVRLWLDFSNLTPTAATADVRLEDLHLRLQPDLAALSLRHVEGWMSGRKTSSGYVGELKRLAMETDQGLGVTETRAELTLTTAARNRGGEFSVNQLDLAALAGLMEHFPLPPAVRDNLRHFAPRGRLAGLTLAWRGAAEAPEGWRIFGGFDDLALAAYGKVPGFSGVSGRIEGDERGGKATLASRNVRIEMPAVFPEPTLQLNRLEADIGWRAAAQGVDLLLQRVSFDNADAAGEAAGTYRYTGSGPGEIDLSAKLINGEGTAVWRYMPLAVNKDARDWLRASILGGRSDSTSLRLKGPLAEFPFRGGKQGIFQVKGGIRGAKLAYASGWPNIEGIDGELLFEGERMLIRAQRAKLMGVNLADVRAEIADLEAPEEILVVNGRARGATQRFLDFIEASPVGERIDHFTEAMRATGNGELDLKLTMPLRHVVDTQVQGRYRFADNQLIALPELPPLMAAQGDLAFTADRLQAKNLRARFLDLPLRLDIGTQPGGTVRIDIAGSASAGELRRFYGARALDHLSGEASWRGSLSVKKPTAELRIESDLRELASSLPEPFNKSVSTALPLVVQGRIDPRRGEWNASLGDAVAVRLEQSGEAWRGRVAVGAPAVRQKLATPPRGVALAVNLPQLDIDRWQALFAANGNGKQAGSPSRLPELTSIDLRSNELHAAQRKFNAVSLQGSRSGARWQFALNSREAEGQLNWDTAGAGRIVGRFARLHLPVAESPTEEKVAQEPRRDMPSIDFAVESLKLGRLALGEAKVNAENRAGLWQAKVEMKNEAARLSGTSRWQADSAAQETALDFKLEVDSIEKLLNAMEMPDAVRRGSGTLAGELHWAGSPFDFDLHSLTGRLKTEIDKGQFKKLEPGVGRLLGVLSLQSLPRRITLDFRDIFSEGFAFDSIAGEARIERGVMSTDELRIRGPAAKILLSGQADLNAETQNLKVRVQPALGESIAVGAMIAVNPAAGVVAWAAQKLLNDPIDQIFAYEYAVTGPWADPLVTKVSRQIPASAAPTP